MSKISIKPVRSEALYQGFYSELAFGVLGNPVPFYRNLLKHLGKFGANLGGLTTNLATLTEASVTCYLQDLSIFVAFRLDRLDVTSGKLHEVSPDIAGQILVEAWATIHDTDESITVARHVVTATIYSQIVGTDYDEVIGRFIKPPEKMSPASQVGAVFYLSDTSSEGSIVLDRIPGQKEGMVVKLSVSFNGKQFAVGGLVGQTTEYLNTHLNSLGIQLEQ